MVRADRQGAHRAAFDKNRKIIIKTQSTCGICGKPVDINLKPPHPLAPVIDHIVPINGPGGVKGHPSDISNLQLAHAACNRQKSNKIFNNKEKAEPKIIGNRNLPHSMDWTTYKSN